MTRGSVRWIGLGALSSALFALAGPCAAGEHLLSATLRTDAGYDANRYNNSEELGSAFLSVSPELRWAWFLSGVSEINAWVYHWREDFEQDTFSHMAKTGAGANFVSLYRAVGFRLASDAAWFQDAAVPADDAAWLRLSPSAWYTGSAGHEYSLRGFAKQIKYDSATTLTGDSLEGSSWELRPGCTVPVLPQASVWADLVADGYRSNERTDEYTGYGAAVGINVTAGRKCRGGASVEWRQHDFASDVPGDTEARRDRPLSLDLWSRYRMYPWLDVLASGRWEDIGSTAVDADYGAWSVQVGFRVVREFAPAR